MVIYYVFYLKFISYLIFCGLNNVKKSLIRSYFRLIWLKISQFVSKYILYDSILQKKLQENWVKFFDREHLNDSKFRKRQTGSQSKVW